MQALNTRYATFYFSDTIIILDVVPHGIREIFRYSSLRSSGNAPSEDFSQMTNVMGNAWWEEENRTAKKYLASRHVLELAQRCIFAAAGAYLEKSVVLSVGFDFETSRSFYSWRILGFPGGYD